MTQNPTSKSIQLKSIRQSVCALGLTALTAIIFTSQTANAAVTISSIERASVVEGAGTSSITVYGGVAGAVSACSSTATDSTCDNCKLIGGPTDGDTNLVACNKKRIHPDLQLVIYLSSDAIDGKPLITNSDGDDDLTTISTPAVVTKGTVTSITLSWRTICAALITATDGGDATNCIPAGDQVSGTFRVGISSTDDGDTLLNGSKDEYRSITVIVRREIGQGATEAGQSLAANCDDDTAIGICQFEMGAGDEKAVVKTMRALNGFPSSTNTQFKHVRFLFSTRGFNYIHAGSDYIDLPISGTDTSTFSVSPKRIEGLTNDTEYYFKAAVVDAAGNVGYYSAAADDTDCSVASDTLCRRVTPSEVVGVLSNTNCFIATAAYGGRDKDATFGHEVEVLRDFRDQYLMNTAVGRAFVRAYYIASPPLALAIVDHPAIRAAIRGLLTPFVLFAELAMNRGLWIAALASIVVLLIASAILILILRKNRPRPRHLAIALAIGLGALSVSPVARAEDTAAAANELDKAIEAETAPEPEYPYPGAKDAEFKTKTANETAAPSIQEKPKRRKARLRTPRPKAVTEDGEYIYATSGETDEVHHGKPEKVKFSGQEGRTPPQTITAEGEYLYPIEHSEFTGAAGVRIGAMAPPNISNPDNRLSFKDIYGSDPVPAVMFEYEYPLTRAIGRVGIKFETGFIVRQGQGHFKSAARATETADERFTFVMVPLQASVMYRFQFADAQWIVPFVEGGANYSGIAELRDDNKAPRVGGSPALIAGGGVSLLLDWIDRRAIAQLDADYGINHVWATAQYRQIQGLKKDLDISSNLISVGVTFDY